MSDSLRGAVWDPEIRFSPLTVADLPGISAANSGSASLPGGPGTRLWWVTIHSWTSLRTNG